MGKKDNELSIMEELLKLKGDELGERLDINLSINWILEKMKYEDFVNFTRLNFWCKSVGYSFNYEYKIPKEEDNKKFREDYLKYMFYKLIQNLTDPNVEMDYV